MCQHASPESEAQAPLFALNYIFVPALMLACMLAFKSPNWTRLLFFAWYTSHLLQGMSIRAGNIWIDYSNGSTLGGELMKNFYLLFFVVPPQDWRHRLDGDHKITSRPWWQRIYWCLCAAYAMRGVGWNYQVSAVPSPSRMSRYMYLGCTALRVLSSYLLLDAAQYLIQAAPFFNDPQPDTSMRSHSYHRQVFYMAVFFAVPYGSLRFYYYTGAFLAVLTRYSSQEDWPDLFGSWSHAYCVRNVWGKTWHQMLRRHFTSFGKAAARLLGAPSRSTRSLIIQLFTAFFFSGIMHSFGDYTLGVQHLGMTLPFFLLQPFAIMFEELFVFRLVYPKVEKHICSLPTPVKRCLGYLWTLYWFTYSSSWYVDSIARAGFGKDDILPFSVVRLVQLASRVP